MMSQTEKQTGTMYIGKQAIKCRQLIEHNVRNIFLQRPCSKRGRETSSRLIFAF